MKPFVLLLMTLGALSAAAGEGHCDASMETCANYFKEWAAKATYSGIMADGLFTDGKVLISEVAENSPAAKAGVQVGDELSNLLSGLCIDVPKALVSDGTAGFYAFASDIEITFTRAGDTITTESEFFAPASFPADALIKALAGVAQRFADTYPRL